MELSLWYPAAVSILEANPHQIYWSVLRRNPNAIHLFEKNGLPPQPFDEILVSSNVSAIVEWGVEYLSNSDWRYLSMNPDVIDLLENNLDKVHWGQFSRNPNAMGILEKHLDKIAWSEFSTNPSIFAYDYDAMKEKTSLYKEELIQRCLHPKRFAKYLYEYNYDLGDDSNHFNL